MSEELRIKSEEWKRLELADIFDISKKKFDPKTSQENRKCIELEHISQGTGKLLGYTDSAEQKSIKNVFKKNQVLFGKLRPYLRKYWKTKFEGVCSTEIWVLEGKNVINDYSFYLVQSDKFIQLANISSGSKMPRADWNYMSQIPFDIPPLKEQQKISQILSIWDEAISKLEALIKTKERFKKGMMQKLLSAELRFPGFEGEWEEVRLREVAEIYKGKGISKNDISDDGMECIRYGELYTIYDEKIEEVVSKTSLRKEELFLSRINDILIPSSGETAIDIATASCVLKNDVAIGGDINIIRTNQNGVFLSYWLNTVAKKAIASIAQGVSVVHLYKDQLKSLKVKLPSIDEQKKIVEVLTAMDNEIKLLIDEIETLKEEKRGLMQKLLTGEVRVKV
jgi:type I restriction enzyme S subunit